MKVGPFTFWPGKQPGLIHVEYCGRRVFDLLGPGGSEITAMQLAANRFKRDMASNIALAQIHIQRDEIERAKSRV